MSSFSKSNNCHRSGCNTGGDDAAMRRAFEQFMMQPKPNTNKTQNSTRNNNDYEEHKKIEERKVKQKQINQLQQELKRAERKYWTIFHRFCDILQDQWLEIDNQALEVIQSISGIRQRLPITIKVLRRYKNVVTKSHSSGWKYQSDNQLLTSPSILSTKALLGEEDVELALSHDLLQHEKMLEALRTLFAKLSEMHQALSRSLDEIMKHHLNEEENIMNYQQHYLSLSMTTYLTSVSLVDLMNELFHMLSMELFRKQTMVHYLLNSTDDRLLLMLEEENSNTQNSNDLENCGPKKIVNYCLRHWSKSDDSSFIDNALLTFAMSLHEKNNILP